MKSPDYEPKSPSYKPCSDSAPPPGSTSPEGIPPDKRNATLGEPDTEQFEVQVSDPGRPSKLAHVERVHDPFITTKIRLSFPFWQRLKILFGSPANVSVRLVGTRGAVSAISSLNPYELMRLSESLEVAEAEAFARRREPSYSEEAE